MDFDQRQVALVMARSRAVFGLVMLVVPGLGSRLLFGNARTNAGTRAALRIAGVRDLLMGIGAITTLKEQTMDAEWVGMGAIADAADGVILFATPGMNARARLAGIGAAATGALGLVISRAIADSRPQPLEIDS